MVEFAFGDIYTREGMTKKEQSLVTISSLVTLGTDPQIELHVNTALTVGLTKEDIVGAITHLIPYIGFPRVLNALNIVKSVLSQRGFDSTAAVPTT
ncbi:carboxymuconolactone decarboxylase family protein [Rhodococcus koreensis]